MTGGVYELLHIVGAYVSSPNAHRLVGMEKRGHFRSRNQGEKNPPSRIAAKW